MRAVLQRARSASVSVGQEEHARIGAGLVVLLGVAEGDTEEDVAWMVKKLTSLRIFDDAAGKLNRSILEVGGSVLLVSQFTLFADTTKGNRPSFFGAAPPEQGRALYERCAELLQDAGVAVATGVFGAHMGVTLTNDGPVTLQLDSRAPR